MASQALRGGRDALNRSGGAKRSTAAERVARMPPRRSLPSRALPCGTENRLRTRAGPSCVRRAAARPSGGDDTREFDVVAPSGRDALHRGRSARNASESTAKENVTSQRTRQSEAANDERAISAGQKATGQEPSPPTHHESDAGEDDGAERAVMRTALEPRAKPTQRTQGDEQSRPELHLKGDARRCLVSSLFVRHGVAHRRHVGRSSNRTRLAARSGT